MTTEHPFAEYIRILGKGKKGSRHLTMEEAEKAMTMVLNSEVEPVQLGAFLLLLRYQLETAEELAGFAKASKKAIQAPPIAVDIDWPSYAGKKRHYPWYLLAAKLLASQGIRVFLHGAGAHTAERIYTEQLLSVLTINNCESWQQVAQSLDSQYIAFMGLHFISPRLQQIIDFKSLFGVRSPVHSLVRMINPLNAKCSLQSVFHPNYQITHQQASQLLGDTSIIIKGEGGENEIRVDSTCMLLGTKNGQLWQENWPALTKQRLLKPNKLALDYFIAVWQKKVQDAYADLAIPATIALALRGLGASPNEALKQGEQLWQHHN